MWRIFGICFFNDKQHFIVPEEKRFDLDKIKIFLKEKRVAIYDTAVRVRRMTGTASDKDLEIVEKADLDGMLRSLPEVRGVLAAGQLATSIFTEHYGINAAKKMKMGTYVEFLFENRVLKLYRMPSSSRFFHPAFAPQIPHRHHANSLWLRRLAGPALQFGLGPIRLLVEIGIQ